MFHISTEEQIKANDTTDIYFERTLQILQSKGINAKVKMEIFLKKFPNNYEWGIFAGLDEVLELFKGSDVNIYSIKEGTVFYSGEPVMIIEGVYTDFAPKETAMLGFICQASGIATKAARVKQIVPDKTVLHFGARRMHPAITPMIERSAYIGGLDGVATKAGAKAAGISPSGTIPHALILMLGDTVKALESYDEIIDETVPRIALIDTFNDEKFEAVQVAEALNKKLFGVRLDTPSSRRGSLKAIVEEVRWELDTRNFNHVKIVVSGGLDEEDIQELKEVVDSFGVGTSISSGNTIDFSADIVEIDGNNIAKRGKMSGAKKTWVCNNCSNRIVTLDNEYEIICEKCGMSMNNILKKVMEKGVLTEEYPTPAEIRNFVLEQLNIK